ncbi:NAD(P)/FAD-dependent oxidoreductase [Zooshikella ganghwensis]|uniref:NAD(P)/FAD-dependent oxidoreductase n=1 Tax=Zooshikella ganghwensis TaxID=202772 RepID=UPI001F231A6A|nr:NAD(P)/FAD-dependent oxidoreductase [Zooshikella ganghwensis]
MKNMLLQPGKQSVDVLIIGAGPAGCVAAAYLLEQGITVKILEKSQFPRFSIGESLLPQTMEILQQTNLLQPVIEAGFQYKNGSIFRWQDEQVEFDFREKFSPGWGITYQVQRDKFDSILASQVESKGAEVIYQATVKHIDYIDGGVRVAWYDGDGNVHSETTQFILDASGFGRVLPKLLKIEEPSSLPFRQSLFTHVIDQIPLTRFDRNKIIITVHPQDTQTWMWLIPFADGSSSLGAVATPEFYQQFAGLSPDQMLERICHADSYLSNLLKGARNKYSVRQIGGYSSSVKSYYGDRYALLGNAGEFLDPVFSSGVTIAFKSAQLACDVLTRQFAGEPVCWHQQFVEPLLGGINTFRAFVDAWYAGALLPILCYPKKDPDVTAMISSVLAGYAWDTRNPVVQDARKFLRLISGLCQ